MIVQIAGKKTNEDWRLLEAKIKQGFNNDELWEEAYRFFKERLFHRYIGPAEQIQQNSSIIGEGFSIMAIICTLIEALETFYDGRCYKYNKPRKNHEYGNGKSGKMFVSFLSNREPFKQVFDEHLAKEFYKNVRCSLLHEAATRSGWVIRIDTDSLIKSIPGKTVLNRKLFLDQMKKYIEAYKGVLIESKTRKNAFIRKMDCICKTA
jgi:hypothetical protein